MLKKILFFLLLPTVIFAYTSKDINISSNSPSNFIIKIKLKKNISYTQNLYDFGVNITLTDFSFDKILIKKINDKFLLKVIPLTQNKTLIKIQSSINFKKELFNINVKNNILTITYGKQFLPESPLNQSKPNEEDKIIEEVTKKSIALSNMNNKQDAAEKESEKNPEIKKESVEKVENFNIEKSDFLNRVIKTYSLLAAICIFLVGMAFLLKRLKNKGMIKPNKNLFKIIYRQQIMPKKELILIKIYDEYLLLGVTEQNINLIEKIDSQILKEKIKLVEGEQEQKKFIKYIKEENKRYNEKEKNIEKDLLISSIEEKIKKYKDKIN